MQNVQRVPDVFQDSAKNHQQVKLVAERRHSRFHKF